LRLAAQVAEHDQAAFETLMRRYNSRLFRVARAILKDDAAAEDALQDAYLDAYRHIGGFQGSASIGTWLTRITINQSLMRLRQQKREQDEQFLREAQRQRMARLQARVTAYDSPLKVDISDAGQTSTGTKTGDLQNLNDGTSGASDLYATAMKSGLISQNFDPSGQVSKEAFFNQDIKDLGYLSKQVVPQFSPYELKRGSVIPATLITGLNSDLPGRAIAQVSANVYDSATGYRLLIPQGAKLFGRYDSKVSFGQQRVLVVWTDISFPNGSTLQLGGMAGTDAEGYGGFKDKTDRHLWPTFGSAVLIALLGTGIDMAIPESSTLATQDTASDAVRRNFAETFGRVAEQTISKNLNVQPTVRIRPGYKFNVLVDQDIIFPSQYVEY